MSNKMRVDVEIVEAMKSFLGAINRSKLEDIEWYKNGKKVKVTDDAVAYFRFTGFSNVDFLTVFGLKMPKDLDPSMTKAVQDYVKAAKKAEK